ncbi:hypothetical protein [Acidianus ambivalens]|uniref:Uncharacterized protein n=1 Tax=Acidianus ambivalens TaxID=2283 RepID=A0A650CXK4_ACIAM|nr:hypothetical protein [Acidianus ambivalens]MQL54363.1 hypothetical protein [Acidianus ambivalens]QGR22187.1 hypothetical protein D1866_09485 [Acidianus ambivalens]
MNKWKTISIVLIFIVVVEGIIIFNQYRHVNLINNNSVNNSEQIQPAYAVTGPEYRLNPVIGSYLFIINSTTQFVKICNYMLIVAVVNINLTKVKEGDSFLLYPAINIGSVVSEALYNNPILNVTITCNKLFEQNRCQYLNFTIIANSPKNFEAYGGVTLLLSQKNLSATSLTHLCENTYLFTVFKSDGNPEEITLEFYIAPLSIGSKL